MGTFTVTRENTERFLNYATLEDMSGLPDKKARYSMILNEERGIKTILYFINWAANI
jgi:aminomethyltransferase